MERADLAARLAKATDAERLQLLERESPLVDIELARALKAFFDENENSDPSMAAGATAALRAVAGVLSEPEARALAAWTSGVAALRMDGRMEAALDQLQEAESLFRDLGQPHAAASTQVIKLYALAMLGRYEEALHCGLSAHAEFLAYGDMAAAAKIETNLGNIYFRRDQYKEAEEFYRAAREHSVAMRDPMFSVRIDNNLATTLTAQYKFQEAGHLYEQALAEAETAGLDVLQAEIECNLGCLALFRGGYDRALDYLERSRRRYATLNMPHESAIAEQELADAYLELNLAPEAAGIYRRVISTFGELGMRAEQARAYAYHVHACLIMGDTQAAREALAQARALYSAEGNAVGSAMVTLTEAQLHYSQGDYRAAAEGARSAEGPLASFWCKMWLLS